MSDCNHDCSSCSKNCGSRTEPQSLLVPQNEVSDIKKVIGVVSGKGGVGKSMVTSLLACAMNRAGKKTAWFFPAASFQDQQELGKLRYKKVLSKY